MSAYVGKLFTAVSAALEFNTATLSGAMDIVIIEDTKGNRKSTPFHARFGKLQILKSRGIPIKVDVNGHQTSLRMLLGAAGEAYFYNPSSHKAQPPQSNARDSESLDNASSASLPLSTADIRPIDASISSDFESDQSSGLDIPVHAASMSRTSNENEIPIFELEPAVSPTCSGEQKTPKALTSAKSLPAVVEMDQIGSREELVLEESYDDLAYVSDSEVELSRSQRNNDPQLVSGPLSPPIFPNRRSWTPADFSTASLTQPDSPSLSDAVPQSEPRSPSSTKVCQSSCMPFPDINNTQKSETVNVNLECETAEANPFDSTEPEDSALFDLPSVPSCHSRHALNEGIIMSAPIYDIDGNEEYKLDARSLDSFDNDGDDYSSSSIHGLQQHVSRVLGNGTTLSHSQLSSSCNLLDSIETGHLLVDDTDPPSDRDDVLVLSLCGGLLLPEMEEAQILELFERHRVSFRDFATDPNMIFDPTMRFRIGNRIVELRVAAPFLIAALAFNERMDLDTLAKQTNVEDCVENNESDELPQSPQTPRRFGWFGWSASPTVVGEPLLKDEEISALDAESKNTDRTNEMTVKDSMQGPNNSASLDEVKELGEEAISALGSDNTSLVKASDGKSENEISVCEKELVCESIIPIDNTNNDELKEGKGEKVAVPGSGGVSFTEVDPDDLSHCPTSEQLNSLDLKAGANSVRFYVEGSTVELHCRAFFWQCHSKIVISDVDGTITRSDVLGHLLPAVGRDWSHVGVAGLYTMIEKNGYKLLYLTARPIGQASQTRAFLQNVTQGQFRLPDGPVLMSPNRLMESLTREVIRRRPHEFKISALREVRNMFSPNYNPFHAGFGNRDTDVLSYRTVGMLPHRIFVVNPRGELMVMKAKYESAGSYSSLQDLVESVFPDISGGGGHDEVRALTENAMYNDWNYWRAQLPSFDIDDLTKELTAG